MFRRTTPLALALALGLSGTAAAATHHPAGHRHTTRSLRTAHFQVINTTGSTLQYAYSDTPHGEWREFPHDVSHGSTGDFTVESDGATAEGRIVFRILDSGYHVEIFGSNPILGTNRSYCNVLLNGNKDKSGPYVCQLREDRKGYNDTNFVAVVKPRAAAALHVAGADGGARVR